MTHAPRHLRLAPDLGTGGNDLLTGSELNDRLAGLLGDDTLIGNGGDDLVLGGAGSDSIYGGTGQNTLFGGADRDVIIGSDEIAFGVGGDDLIFGGAGNDYLDGGFGTDRIYGGAGDDAIMDYTGLIEAFGGAGNDLMLAGGGVLWGQAGADTLQGQDARGGADNDKVFGDSLASRLAGGVGDDTLTAIGFENDTLIGGQGADLFVFFGTSRGVDRVSDFDAGQDVLDLTAFGVTAANLAEHAVQQGRNVEISLTGTTGALTVVVAWTDLADLLA